MLSPENLIHKLIHKLSFSDYIYDRGKIMRVLKPHPYYVYILPNPLLSERSHTVFIMGEVDHTQVPEWRKAHTFDHVWSWPHSGKWVKEGTYILITCEASNIQVLCIKFEFNTEHLNAFPFQSVLSLTLISKVINLTHEYQGSSTFLHTLPIFMLSEELLYLNY